jgi:hypothetical protein
VKPLSTWPSRRTDHAPAQSLVEGFEALVTAGWPVFGQARDEATEVLAVSQSRSTVGRRHQNEIRARR